MEEIQRLRRRVRVLLLIFIVGLVLSGLTAFPLEWELRLLHGFMQHPSVHLRPALEAWIAFVNTGLHASLRPYPFLAYGTDWLAFAHLVIAVAFIGPWKDPVRNVWVIEFGMIACVLVIPLALIMGPLRGIPFFWQLIDCSFGVIGIIPLWLIRRAILRLISLERVQQEGHVIACSSRK